jgi:2-polyprenyl-3-methyl-5-hydroxy-6-metoxy-1,4-benzoquinol methylase
MQPEVRDVQPEVREMLRVNQAQREYYEHADGAKESEVNGFATNLWRRWRERALSVFQESEINDSLSKVHLQWLNRDISTLKVLDLGVGYGNPLSMTFARQAREYIAIDLSQPLVDRFQRQLERAGLRNARACLADILSDEFAEKDFDLVYARAVFHHFRYFDAFVESLSGRIAPGGQVITLDDPIETWLPIKLLRLAYRPFQTDASWEFPFTSATLRSIQRHFNVMKSQGTYDSAKWAIPLGFIAPKYARRCASEWHRKDLKRAYSPDNVTSSLRVSFLLQKKEPATLLPRTS